LAYSSSGKSSLRVFGDGRVVDQQFKPAEILAHVVRRIGNR